MPAGLSDHIANDDSWMWFSDDEQRCRRKKKKRRANQIMANKRQWQFTINLTNVSSHDVKKSAAKCDKFLFLISWLFMYHTLSATSSNGFVCLRGIYQKRREMKMAWNKKQPTKSIHLFRKPLHCLSPWWKKCSRIVPLFASHGHKTRRKKKKSHETAKEILSSDKQNARLFIEFSPAATAKALVFLFN